MRPPHHQGFNLIVKFKGIFVYTLILFFLVWYGIVFRADIARIRFEPVWAARDAVIMAVLLSLLNYGLRMVRWSLFLGRLGHSLSFGFTGLTYLAGFAFTLSPGKVGELMRGRYYQKIDIPLSTTTAAFFIERLLDLLAILALAFLALASLSAYRTLIWAAVAIVAAALVVLALAPWARIAEEIHSKDWLPTPLQKASQSIVQTLLSARALLQPRTLSIGFLIGLVAWGAEGTGLMLLGAIAPAVSIDWATATGIYAVAIIVGALSFLPGGLGTTEAVMIALLAAHGYTMPDAILLTLVCRLVTLWLAVAIGWGAVFTLRCKPMLQALR